MFRMKSSNTHNHGSLGGLAPLLPKQTYSATGKPMEPINLIVLGKLELARDALRERGWKEAEKISFTSVLKTIFAELFRKSYPSAPLAPSYINKHRFFVALERPTETNTFYRRHHMRLWKTSHHFNSLPVSIGTVSYDRSTGVSRESMLPTHHIAPTLVWEEEFLAHSLGITKPVFLRLGPPVDAYLNNGDHYVHDGRALVLDVTRINPGS
jgi:hypothetical protein